MTRQFWIRHIVSSSYCLFHELISGAFFMKLLRGLIIMCLRYKMFHKISSTSYYRYRFINELFVKSTFSSFLKHVFFVYWMASLYVSVKYCVIDTQTGSALYLKFERPICYISWQNEIVSITVWSHQLFDEMFQFRLIRMYAKVTWEIVLRSGSVRRGEFGRHCRLARYLLRSR